MSYGWPPGLGTCQTRVSKAVDVCGSVGNAGKLHRALRDWKCEGKALDSRESQASKFSKVLSVDTSIIY